MREIIASAVTVATTIPVANAFMATERMSLGEHMFVNGAEHYLRKAERTVSWIVRRVRIRSRTRPCSTRSACPPPCILLPQFCWGLDPWDTAENAWRYVV
jgi:hypothetical protein